MVSGFLFKFGENPDEAPGGAETAPIIALVIPKDATSSSAFGVSAAMLLSETLILMLRFLDVCLSPVDPGAAVVGIPLLVATARNISRQISLFRQRPLREYVYSGDRWRRGKERRACGRGMNLVNCF